ncbi:MAG: hypothetical protein Ta2G_09900 [Termitinemataceae bacterium]|nr:MAG: hypothetical protein Ta2G_09900 [Termitinemataceae bacterium]
MKKKPHGKISIVCAVLIALLSTVLFLNRENITLKPWQKTGMIDFCVYAAQNDERLAVSGNGKKSVIVVNNNHELIYSLQAKHGDPASFTGVVFLALDNKNNLYVLDWDFGGAFKSNTERILKYDANGQFVKEIFTYHYQNEDYILSKGKITDIVYSDGYIYFARSEHEGFYLEKVATDEFTESEIVSFHPYPNAGGDLTFFAINPETKRLTITTKSGIIKQFDFNGNQLGEWSGISESFPYMAISDSQNNIVYSDTLSGEIVKLNTITDERSVVIPVEKDILYYEINYINGTIYTAPNTEYILMRNDSGLTNIFDSYTFSSHSILIHWLLYICFIIDAAALLIFVITLIALLRNVKVTDVFKQILMATICISLGAAVAVILIVRDMNVRIEESNYSNLENISRVMASVIDTDVLKEINSASAWDSEEYKTMHQDILTYFRSLNFVGQSVYQNIYVVHDGILYAVYDTESSLGCYYPYFPIEGTGYQNTYENGTYEHGALHDAAGSWFYVFGPIVDKDGGVEAIIETGYSLTLLEQQNRQMMVQSILIVLSTAIVFLLILIEMIVISGAWSDYKILWNVRSGKGNLFRPELLRAVVFFLFFSSNIATALVPMYAAKLYVPIFKLSREVIITLPFTASVTMLIIALLVVPLLIKSIGIKRLALFSAIFFTLGNILCWAATNVVFLSLGYALNGFCTGTIVLALNTLIGAQRNETVIASGFAHFNASYLAGVNAGIVLGAIIAQFFPYRIVFLFGAFFAVILLLVISFSITSKFTQSMFIKNIEPYKNNEKSLGIVAFLFKPIVLCTLILVLIPFMITMSFIDYFLPLFGSEHGLTESNIGQLILLSGLLAILFGTKLCKTAASKMQIKTILLVAVLINALGLYLFSLTPTIPVLIIAIIFMAVSNIFAATNIQTYYAGLYQLSEVSPAKALSLYSIFENLAVGIGPVVFSYILSGIVPIGIKMVVFIILTGMILFLIIAYFADRQQAKRVQSWRN